MTRLSDMTRRPRAVITHAALPAIALLGLGGCGGDTAPLPHVFDVYQTGVPIARVDVSDSTYIVQTRDVWENRWAEPRELTAAEIEASEDLSSVHGIPALLEGVGDLDWSGEDVEWPDRPFHYVRHRELTADVAGRESRAVYWAVRDGSRPPDLVLNEDGRFIALVNPSTGNVVVRRGYEGFTPIGRWLADDISQSEYGVTALPPVRVPAHDGTELATLVYLPRGTAEASFPTILVRTPYGIGPPAIDRYAHYVTRGYAVMLQAARGTSYWDPEYRSGGEWDPMVNEPADGAAALEWIVAQPWSNGDICMEGGSYVGYTQWAASMSANPALRCVVPESSMGTAFSDQPFMGGGFVEGLAYYMFWMLDVPILPDRTWIDILHHRPIADMDVFATGRDIRQWNEMVDHWRNDTYWKRQDWYADDDPRAFGSLQISGWWDDDFPGTQANWELMQRRGVGPQHLVVGPWRHGYNADRALNGFSFGIDALRDDIWLLKQRWYDHFLKGMDNGVAGTTVDYFVLGDNEWRRATSWPPEDATEERWYLHSDGSAASSTGAGSLSTAPPELEQPVDTWVYDPSDPPMNWTDFENMTSWEDIQSFPADFAGMESRGDVAVFTSDVLTDDLTIAGPIVVELHASTDVLDTDWWAHLSDVYPDGRSVRLSTGLIRARFRGLDDPVYKVEGSNFETEELLSGDPNDVVRYEFSLPAVANTFKPGHRIRIAVMNALDNYSFPNSNTGEHEAYATTTVPGTMSLHHSPGRASNVRFYILPR